MNLCAPEEGVGSTRHEVISRCESLDGSSRNQIQVISKTSFKKMYFYKSLINFTGQIMEEKTFSNVAPCLDHK